MCTCILVWATARAHFPEESKPGTRLHSECASSATVEFSLVLLPMTCVIFLLKQHDKLVRRPAGGLSDLCVTVDYFVCGDAFTSARG